MKKLLLLCGILLAIVLSACGNQPALDHPSSVQHEVPPVSAADPVDTFDESNRPASMHDTVAEGGKNLIVYFTWSGNTEKMAESIAERSGGYLFRLEPANPYPKDYDECTAITLEERDNNARPEITELLESIEGYDRIFIGYPIWWHTAPMIIGTFLESYDLTDVEIYPFSQSASMDAEQFENSMDFIRSCADNADVHDGLFASADDADAITTYLIENDLMME